MFPEVMLPWCDFKDSQLPAVNTHCASVQVAPKSLEGLLAAMATPGVHQLNLSGATLRLGRKLQEQGPTESLVLRAWPAGCAVIGGTLHLPDSAVVLLSGRGACFTRTAFSGAPDRA